MTTNERAYTTLDPTILPASQIPKPKFVLQDWVGELTLRQQGVLILALRGPDGVPKEHPAKPIVRSLRALVMNSGRESRAMTKDYYPTDGFMRMDINRSNELFRRATKNFMDGWDSYNIHFIQHLLHATAIIGYTYPHDGLIQGLWRDFYVIGCLKLHMNPESKHEILHRLRDGIREDQDE